MLRWERRKEFKPHPGVMRSPGPHFLFSHCLSLLLCPPSWRERFLQLPDGIQFLSTCNSSGTVQPRRESFQGGRGSLVIMRGLLQAGSWAESISWKDKGFSRKTWQTGMQACIPILSSLWSVEKALRHWPLRALLLGKVREQMGTAGTPCALEMAD